MTDIEKMDAAQTGASAASAVGYGTFPNTMPASQEAAPCLGRAYAADTVNQKEVYACMKELGYQMGEAEAYRIWNATGFAIKNRMPIECRSYNVGFARFFPALGGTFDSADAEFDPERNRLYVAAAPSADIRDALIDGTPTRIGEMPAKGGRIDNVTYGDGMSANTLKSGEPFEINGSGLTVGVGDEHAELVLPDGTSALVVLEAPSGGAGIAQRLVGRLANAAESCEGAVLRIWTHGFSRDAALVMVSSNRLTVVAGETPPVTPPPELTKIYSFQHEDDTEHLYDGSSAIMEGTALGGATLKFQANSSGTWSEEIAVPSDEFEVTGTKITVDGMWLADECATLDVGYTDPVRFIVTTPNGTAMIASIWTENS